MADYMAQLEGIADLEVNDNPAKALFALGKSYESGTGSVAVDMKLARSNYEEAVELGSGPAALALALLHLRGELSDDVDLDEAIQLLVIASDAGLEEARETLQKIRKRQAEQSAEAQGRAIAAANYLSFAGGKGSGSGHAEPRNRHASSAADDYVKRMTAIGSSGGTDEAGPGGTGANAAAGGQAGGGNSEGGIDGEAGGAWLSRNASTSGDASEGTVRFEEGS